MPPKTKPSPKESEASVNVSKYIAELPDWSKTICTRLRKIILNADPSLTEGWKWCPLYTKEGMVCCFSAFQKHTKLTFCNGSGMKDSKGLFNHCVDNDFNRSIKFTSEDQIDEKALTEYVKESVKLNTFGWEPKVKDKTVEVPKELAEALEKDKNAKKFFDELAYTYQKEFVEHVTTAKQEKTKLGRIAKVVGLCSEGKKLNEKYAAAAKEAKKAVKRAEPKTSDGDEEGAAELKKVKKTAGKSKK